MRNGEKRIKFYRKIDIKIPDSQIIENDPAGRYPTKALPAVVYSH
jgi:hypothetical protein